MEYKNLLSNQTSESRILSRTRREASFRSAISLGPLPHGKRGTLFLDLDNTLVLSLSSGRGYEEKQLLGADFSVEVPSRLAGTKKYAVFKRRAVDEFLAEA